MVIPDVNVLVYALREDAVYHASALGWLIEQLSVPRGEVVIPDLVWVGVARICTNPRVFPLPSTIAEVANFFEDVVSQPTCRNVPGLAFGVAPLLTLMAQADARGNAVTDAYIAAIALQLGATVCTYDRDFRRFDGLKIVTPV